MQFVDLGNLRGDSSFSHAVYYRSITEVIRNLSLLLHLLTLLSSESASFQVGAFSVEVKMATGLSGYTLSLQQTPLSLQVYPVLLMTFIGMIWITWPFLFLKNLLIFIFIYFWLCWVFVAAHGLVSLVAVSGAYSSLQCVASHCGGFSCCEAWALGMQASVVVACELSSCGSWALEHRLSSCGAWAQLLCGIWDLPRPGLKPVSPALAGGFLTTAPSWKPHMAILDPITVARLDLYAHAQSYQDQGQQWCFPKEILILVRRKSRVHYKFLLRTRQPVLSETTFWKPING